MRQFVQGYLLGLLSCVLVMAWCALTEQQEGVDEQWCGCDGEGMAHKPGAKGFGCAPASTPKIGKGER